MIKSYYWNIVTDILIIYPPYEEYMILLVELLERIVFFRGFLVL